MVKDACPRHAETLVHLQTAAAHAIACSRSRRLSQAHGQRQVTIIGTGERLKGEVVGFRRRRECGALYQLAVGSTACD